MMEPVPASLSPVRSDADFLAQALELTEKEKNFQQAYLAGFYPKRTDYYPYTAHMNYTTARNPEANRDTVFQVADQGLNAWFHALPHTRYTNCPWHDHSFLELTFLVTGECTQLVESDTVRMQPGDLLFLAPGTHHTIEMCGEKDLLYNLLFFPHQKESILNHCLKGSRRFNAFFTDALYIPHPQPNYIHVQSGRDPLIHATLLRLLRLYATHRIAEQSILHLISTLFILLTILENDHPEAFHCRFEPDVAHSQLLSYLRANCSVCRLEDLAVTFNYSKSYMCTKLKQYTGRSFTELRNDFRLKQAYGLLQQPTAPSIRS